jgi:hypothetical protein
MPSRHHRGPIDGATWPSFGDGFKEPRKTAFKLKLDGAQRCCLEHIYRAHGAGELTGDRLACSCLRAWTLQSGWWAVSIHERRPRAASKSMQRKAAKDMHAAPPGSGVRVSMREVHRRRAARVEAAE